MDKHVLYKDKDSYGGHRIIHIVLFSRDTSNVIILFNAHSLSASLASRQCTTLNV